MTKASEDTSLEIQVATIQKKLDAGETWAALTREERKVIVQASRTAGLSWRKIAERVGKKRNQHSTITQWVAHNLPGLIAQQRQSGSGTQIGDHSSPIKRREGESAKAGDCQENSSNASTGKTLAKLEKKLATVESIAHRLDVIFANTNQNTGVLQQEVSGSQFPSAPPPPPPPLSSIGDRQSKLTASSSPRETWDDFDWSPAHIAELSQPEIESIPTAILETLSTAVLT